MPLDLAELRQRIAHAVAGIDHQMLVRVWQELDYTVPYNFTVARSAEGRPAAGRPASLCGRC